MNTFVAPTVEQRRLIRCEYGIKYDRRIREEECSETTSLSRSNRWKMEPQGRFPLAATSLVTAASGSFLMCSGGCVILRQLRM